MESELSGVEVINLMDRYTILDGGFGKSIEQFRRTLPALCRQTGLEVALRVQKKGSLKKFQREFSYSRLASPHRHIINTFDVQFCCEKVYGFVQEKVPFGYLNQYISVNNGLDDLKLKRVMVQISMALKFLHSTSLVHRAVCSENIAVFEENLEWVKLCDFSLTHSIGTMVRKQIESGVCSPPEISECVRNEWYSVEPSADVWAIGVMLYHASTCQYPWTVAQPEDPNYTDFMNWQKRKTVRVPYKWRMFTVRALRLFRRVLEPKETKRCCIYELDKYVNDSFTARNYRNSLSDEEDSDFLGKVGVKTARNKGRKFKDWLKSVK